MAAPVVSFLFCNRGVQPLCVYVCGGGAMCICVTLCTSVSPSLCVYVYVVGQLLQTTEHLLSDCPLIAKGCAVDHLY